MGRNTRGVIGVLGGMGPWATLDLFRRILALTPAQRDQDHLHVIIENNPAVPDRTAAIRGEGESPFPALVEGAQRLMSAGADFIVMPCNTAHHWIAELRDAVAAPILDMADETVQTVVGLTRGVRRVGLLATTGTIEGGVYHRRFARCAPPATVLVPDEMEQTALVMKAIYGAKGLKAGHASAANRRRLVRAAQQLTDAGAQVLVAACTEIPLVLRPKDVSVPLVDALDCLARAAVRHALGESNQQAVG
jgi:aspartate racemase